MKTRHLLSVGVLVAAMATTACTENSRKGAGIGAAVGAGAGLLGGGGLIRGAATGAAVGGVGGYVYDKVK